LIASIQDTGALFRNPVFWAFYRRHPELAEARIQEWYGALPTLAGLLEQADVLGEHRILLLDPGILAHFEKFLPFAQAELSENPDTSVWALRRKFSESLEPVTLWRGMMLTDAELDRVLDRGLVSTPLRGSVRRSNAVLASGLFGRGVYMTPSKGPLQDMQDRLRSAGENSVYTSVSSRIEVTHAGAWRPPPQGGLYGPGKFRLLKLHMSPLDVVRAEGAFDFLVQWKGQEVYYATTGVDGRPWRMRFDDPDLELFIQYAAPDEIISPVYTYDAPPPSWHREDQPR
jgi:hypothetical protein